MSQAETSAPASPVSGVPGNILVIFGALALVLLLAALDQTIVATALPTIVSELGERDHPSTEDELCRHVRMERALLHALADRTIAHGLVTRDAAGRLDFTAVGRSLYARLLVLRRNQLESLLQRWHPSKHADVRDMLTRLARHLSTSPPLVPEAR